MADEEELYDEFGNYIGPDLDSSDDESSDNSEEDESNDDSTNSTISQLEEEDELPNNNHSDMEIEESGTPSTAIVLHEDKEHYPSASTIYGETVQTVTLDEDTMDLETPIIEPVKTKQFSLMKEDAIFGRSTNIGHTTDKEGAASTEETPQQTSTESPFQPIVASEYLTLLLSNEQTNISPRRAICLIGHFHSGKTTLCDTLLEQTYDKLDIYGPRACIEGGSGGNSKGGFPRMTDVLVSEQDRGLSIKSTPLSLPLPDLKGKTNLLTIMDTPGHANFHEEVVASLELSDGACIVMDVLEGIRMSTVMSVKAAIRAGLPLCLVLNKMDRLILELRLPPNDAYFKVRHVIESMNKLIYKESHGRYGRHYFKPQPLPQSNFEGNVIFASSVHGWTFTLMQMTQLYQDIFDLGDGNHAGLGSHHLSHSELASQFWGDVYYHSSTHVFSSDIKSSKRTFVEFVLEPIYKIYAACLGEKESTMKEMFESVGVYLSKDQLSSSARVLMRTAMKRFFGDSNAGFVEMICKTV